MGSTDPRGERDTQPLGALPLEPVYPQVALVDVKEEETIAKAVVAGSTALATAIGTALSDGHVTVWEVVLGVLLAAGSAAAVWSTSNKK